MGRGGGCVPSNRRRPIGASNHALSDSLALSQVQASPSPSVAADATIQKPEGVGDCEESRNKLKIYIVFYSMYGHVETLARRMKEGVDSIDGVEGVLFQIPETLPKEVLQQMGVPRKEKAPPVARINDLAEADGFLFGFPTRFGSMAAQAKNFFDSTYDLWSSQKLAGVPAGFFVSTGTQGGGQETTAWTAITQLVHHGMIYVPIGYTFGAGMFSMDNMRGGSPYGAGVYSGDGTRIPTELELALAEHQGRYMATTVRRLGRRPS